MPVFAGTKWEVIENFSLRGVHLERDEGDRLDVPIDFRFMDLLLHWNLSPKECEPDQAHVYLVFQRCTSRRQSGGHLNRPIPQPALWINPASRPSGDEITCHWPSSQRRSSTFSKTSLAEARRSSSKNTKGDSYPHLVVSLLGANRKVKPHGVFTARVLFDGTNGIEVNNGRGFVTKNPRQSHQT